MTGDDMAAGLLGYGTFLIPADGWPSGWAVLECVFCHAQWVGPINEKCGWCRRRVAELVATPQRSAGRMNIYTTCTNCGYDYDPLTASERPKCEDQAQDATITLDECLDVYRRWLHLPDTDQVVAALGATAANLLPGDPLWLLFVGSPGSGKTETIAPLSALPYIYPASTFTEAALLSGVVKRDVEKDATGGLLRQIGDFGIILAKDFSGVLSMHRDARAQTLAALREVYDGSWSRVVGTGGGKTLQWAGKCGFVGGVTTSIDRHHAVMGALGERFVLYRIDVDDPRAQGRRSLANRSQGAQMRAELGDAVTRLLNSLNRDEEPRKLDEAEIERLVDLSAFVVGARTAVERDGYDRQVEVMPAAEAPGRLIAALGSFQAGLEAVGANPDTVWRIVTKAAWDCLPGMRRLLLHELRGRGHARASELIAATDIPKTPADRTLEDLCLLGLVERHKQGAGDTSAWIYELSAETASAWLATSPETSEGTYTEEQFEEPF